MTIVERSFSSVAPSQGVSRIGTSTIDVDGVGSGHPHSDDLALFQQTFKTLSSPLGSVAKPSTDATLLGELSAYLSGRRSMTANQMSGMLNTRDPATIAEVGRQLSDQAIEQDLLVKVIGKTVSSIDQLTKLN